MGILRISDFSGLIPKLAARQLPDRNAQYAVNAKLGSGELRGWGALRNVATADVFARRVYHFKHNGTEHYMAFSRDTELVRALMVNDSFDRIYYTDATGFYVNTAQRVLDGLDPYVCGVPTPICTGLQVKTAGGTSNTGETRVYSCTLVSTFGEESAPSIPAIGNGNSDGTWTIKGIDSLIFDYAKYANVTKLRLYRTITSDSGVDYRMVQEWALDNSKHDLLAGAGRFGLPATYTDKKSSESIATSFQLQTGGWSPPPEGLRGVIACSGGFLAGYVGNTIRFSVPYQPHAWPDNWQLAVEDTIVGLGVFGNTVVAVTTGRPAAATGYSPDAMALTNFPDPYPCSSVHGIVSTSVAVLFPSELGLVSVDPSGVNVITAALMTRDEWQQFSPSDIRAAAKDSYYVGFYSDTLGFALDFTDPSRALTNLMLPGVTGLDIDRLTGRLLVLRNRDISEWDSDITAPMESVWRSKPFILTKPSNFGAIQVRGRFSGTPQTKASIPASGYAVNTNDADAVFPLGGHYNTRSNTADPGCARVRVIADGRVVWDMQVADEEIHRLPSGFKATTYEVEVTTAVPILSVTLAGTPHELENAP